MMPSKNFNFYQISIHVLLVALVATVLGLVNENRKLRSPPWVPVESQLEGQTMRSFSVRGLDGRPEILSFEGSDRESLLFVFTATCPSCKENQQNWRSLYEQAKENYEIVGISLSELAVTTSYSEIHRLPFRVVVPEDAREFATGNEFYQVPLTVHVGRDGKIRRSWLGVPTMDSLTQLMAISTSAVKG